jgi:N-acetylneuraminic acid mutarotase
LLRTLRKFVTVLLILTVISSIAIIFVPKISAADSETWVSKKSMPTARSNLAAVSIDNKIYAIGGFIYKDGKYSATSLVEVYDTLTDTWISGKSLPISSGLIGAVVIERKIYVLCGETSQLFVFDVDKNEWSELQKLPADANTGSFGMAVVQGKIYVARGSGEYPSGIYWTYCYDPISNTWTKKSPIPYHRTIESFAELNGKLYAIGGGDPSLGGRIEVTRVDVYDPSSDSWTLDAIPRMSTPRTHLEPETPVVNGKIYVIGGWDGYSTLNSVEEYDPTTNSWRKIASMPTARYGLATAVVGNKIYAIGGDSGGYGGNPKNANEELTIAPISEYEFSVVGPLNGIIVFSFTYKEDGTQKIWNPKLAVKVLQNGKPKQGAQVKFFVDDKEFGVSNSDASGIAKITYDNSVEGRHKWYVTCGNSKSQTWEFIYKKPKEPKPEELILDFIARWKIDKVEWASLEITKYYSKSWSSFSDQYSENTPAEIGGSKPDITLLNNSIYLAYFSLNKIPPGFGSSRTLVISIPKALQLYDYASSKWLSIDNIEEKGPWTIDLFKSVIPPSPTIPCQITDLKGNRFTWHLVSGIYWSRWGSLTSEEGRKVYEKFKRETVDYLCFLQDDRVVIDTAGDKVSLPILAHVSWIKAIFVDEDSNYAYYALITDAPDSFESVYFSIPIRPKKEGSYKMDIFKSPTLSDAVAQSQQIAKIFLEAKSFVDALAQAETVYDIVAAVGSKGHGLFTALSNLANLEKANHDEIKIKVSKSFLEAKLSSPANLLIIDSLGRKTGFDPSTGIEVCEIPDSYYTGAGREPQIIIINNPLACAYKVEVIGTDSGSYSLTVTFSCQEGVTNYTNFTAQIEKGETKEYSFELSPSGEIRVLQQFPIRLYVIAVVIICLGAVSLLLYTLHRKKYLSQK